MRNGVLCLFGPYRINRIFCQRKEESGIVSLVLSFRCNIIAGGAPWYRCVASVDLLLLAHHHCNSWTLAIGQLVEFLSVISVLLEVEEELELEGLSTEAIGD